MASILKLDTLQTPSGTGVITSTNKISYPGAVLQVVSVTDTTQYIFSAGTASQSTFYDVAGLMINITPISATSKFLLNGHVTVSQATNAYNIYLRFARNSTPIASSIPGSGYISSGTATVGFRTSVDATINALPLQFYDTPNTASMITYKIQVCNSGGSSYASYINRANTTDTGWQQNGVSTFTVMEIAQ